GQEQHVQHSPRGARPRPGGAVDPVGDRHPACDHAERGGSVGQATGMREVHDCLCEGDQCGGGEGEHGGEECERGGGEEEFSFHRAAFRLVCRWMRVSAVTYTASDWHSSRHSANTCGSASSSVSRVTSSAVSRDKIGRAHVGTPVT